MAELVVTCTDGDSRTLDNVDLTTIAALITGIAARPWEDVVLNGRGNGVRTRHRVADIREITIRLP